MQSSTVESHINQSRFQILYRSSQAALKALRKAPERSPLTERGNASQLDSSSLKRQHDDSEAEGEAKTSQLGKRRRTAVEPLYSKGLRKRGTVVVGNGKFSATVRELIHEEKDSAYFLKGPIKQVKPNPDYLNEAATLNLIKESALIKTSDGKPMIYFIKQGMLAGMMADMAKKLASQSEQSFKDLTAAYKPIVPANDPRHRGEEKEKWSKRGLDYGLFHFALWHMQCHVYDKPILSQHSRPLSEAKLKAVVDHMKNTSWEHEILSSWLKALDYPVWQEYHKSYQGLKGDLEHLYQGPQGCQSSLAVLINMTVGPHKDKGDVKDGLVATTCYGDFEGAHAVFPELHTKLDQRPGDIVLAMSAVSEHYITPIESGERQGHTRFTKEDILHPHEKRFDCPFEGCVKGFKTTSSVKRHLGPKTKTGHALDGVEVNKLMSKTKLSMNKTKETETYDLETSDGSENVVGSLDGE